jgi:hypothetical protein
MIGEDKSKANVRSLTPLAISILKGNLEIMDFFINIPWMGVNILDDFGRAPLHYACETEFQGLLKHLIVIGADVDKQDT